MIKNEFMTIFACLCFPPTKDEISNFRTIFRKIAWHDRCEFPDRACTRPLRAPPSTVTQFTYARAQPHEILIRLTVSDRRWTTVQVPFTGLRAGLHPTVEFAATPEESRRSGGAGEEPAVPLQHLRQGLRHGVQPPYPHVEGQSCMYQIRRPTRKFADTRCRYTRYGSRVNEEKKK